MRESSFGLGARAEGAHIKEFRLCEQRKVQDWENFSLRSDVCPRVHVCVCVFDEDSTTATGP